MKRLHLVELEDLPWVPAVVRDAGRDLLDLGFDRLGFYRALVPRLAELLKVTGIREVVDLASGGGGGALTMARALRADGLADVKFLLTDRFPNAGAADRIHALGDANLRYHPDPVDALSAQKRPPGIRTIFGALHHFEPPQVKQFLAAVVEERAPVAVFDVAASDKLRKLPAPLFPLAAIPNLLMLVVATWLLVPLLRPVRPSYLLLTYLLPLIPLLVAWDGTVSAVRAYKPDELLEMARSVPGAEGYEWEAGVGGNAIFLVGRPRSA